MDRGQIDNQLVKDLAHSNQISAIELPSLKIHTELSPEDELYLENEIIPETILRHFKSNFSSFSEEWEIIKENTSISEVSRSEKINFKFFHLQSPHFNFKNQLLKNTYITTDNFQIVANESRLELIITDGEVHKSEKSINNSVDSLFHDVSQELVVFNSTLAVILQREKKTTISGRWGHFDNISFYMSNRTKLDYLRMYIGSKF